MPIMDELLNQQVPARVRNNHALEHATLHVLQGMGVNTSLGGISDAGGFWIFGDVATETLAEAAQAALQRLADGESDLAVHPNCGTNLAIGALSAGGMAWLSMLGTKGRAGRRIRRLPVAVLMGLIGYQVAKPLGPKVQEKITTDANVNGLKVLDVVCHDAAGYTIHRVSTQMDA